MRNLLAMAIGLTLCVGLTGAHAAPAYVLAQSVPLGAPDRWDYVVFDAPSGRVYVAHGDALAVIDGATARLIGQVEGIAGGTHGTGIAQVAGQGFTDDGRNGQVIAFDLQTLKVVKRIAVDADADGVAADPFSGHIFVVEGDPAKIKVIDPKTDAVVATIAGGEKMEYIASAGLGAVLVAGEEKRDVLKVDVKTNTVTARWPMPDCQSPHGLVLDVAAHRAFMSCVNSLMVVIDTQSGRLVAKLPIGRGSDAAAFDPVRKRAFSSNGLDGTISVYQQKSPDLYEALDPIHTAFSARTMAVDPRSGRLFVAGADVLAHEVLSKAPQATLMFWLVKICATTVGETGGDAASMTLKLGYAVATMIFLGFFAVTLAAQISTRRYQPLAYWLVVVATTTVGTTTSDFIDRTLHLGYVASSAMLLTLVILVLIAWRLTTGRISADRITSRRDEAFYWLTILVSNTLGTALGDFTADDTGLNLGFEKGALLFAGLIALVAVAHKLKWGPQAVLFWAAYILTRPLGATLGDTLTKPHAQGGLEFGRITATLAIGVAMVVLVLLSPKLRRPAQPAG